MLVASVFGDCEMTERAAVRRGYPVMRSRSLNFGDDIHDQSVRERTTDAIQRIPSDFLILAFPSRVWSPILKCATSRRVRERIDGERATESAILEWVVSLCEIQDATGNMFLVKNPSGASSWNQSSI